MARIKLLILSLIFYGNIFNLFASTRKEIEKLNKDISLLESRLDRAEKYYTSTLKMREFTEYKSERLRERLALKKEVLKERKKNIQKNFMGILVNSLDKNKTPGGLIADDIMVQSLKKRMQDTEEHLNETKGLEKLLNKAIARYREYVQTEKELNSLLFELKNKKTVLLKKRRFKKGLSYPLKRSFGLPLKNYSSIDYGKKGITLRFDKEAPLYSTGKGKIAYVGTLSTYGNLIMIDHGRDIRSVLLGSFKAKVKKGQTVQKYEPIGISDHHTLGSKIYFEVRKKHRVQNTMLLIEKDLLAENGLTSTRVL